MLIASKGTDMRKKSNSDVLSQAAEPLKNLMAKLSGKNGIAWLDALNMFMRNENPWQKFPVLWAVKLGLFKTSDEYEKALAAEHIMVSEYALEILRKIKFCKRIATVKLASTTVAGLGFFEGGTTEQINAAIIAKGYKLCSPEVVPAMYIALKEYSDVCEWLEFIMKGVNVSDVGELSFVIARKKGTHWLETCSSKPKYWWDPSERIVFVVPPKRHKTVIAA